MSIRASVLVTGGAGYVGSALVGRLLAQGRRVHVLDRFLYGSEPLREFLDRPELVLHPGDVRDIEVVRRACEDCELAVHLADVNDGQAFDLEPLLARGINLQGLKNVFQEALSAGVTAVWQLTWAPARAVAGLTPSRRVATPFDLCELCREEFALQNAGRGTAFSTLRIPPLSGLSPRMRFDLPVHEFAARGYFLGEASQRCFDDLADGLHLDDLLDLLLRVLDWPPEVCDGALVEVTEPVRSGDQRPAGRVLGDTAPPRSFPNSPSAASVPDTLSGWRPHRSADQALRAVIDRLEHGAFGDALSNPLYSNSESLRRLDRGELRRAA